MTDLNANPFFVACIVILFSALVGAMLIQNQAAYSQEDLMTVEQSSSDRSSSAKTESDCGPGTVFYPKAGVCVPVDCPSGWQRTSKVTCAPNRDPHCDIECQQIREKAIDFLLKKARDKAIGLIFGPYKYLKKILDPSELNTFETSGCANNPSPEVLAACEKEYPFLKKYKCVTFQKPQHQRIA